ncbi:MAG: tetratricopeptide repeat protein [Alphaproteobacteria bacterium]|nr:tetratricopeptide repeat protein [Alphaproteobacteria bacterium]
MAAKAAASSFAAGLELHRAGRIEEAAGVYRDILAAEPEHVDALSHLGIAHQQRGEYQEAAALLERAAQKSPKVPNIWSNFGVVLAALGRLDEAIEAYRRAVALAPHFTDALYNLGNLHSRLGDLAEAEACYRKAIATRPDHADAWNNLGNAIKNDADMSGAIAAYSKAIELKPDYTVALGNLGNLLRREGRLDEALPFLDRAVASSPRAEPRFLRALAIPPIIESRAGITACRAALERNLEALEASRPSLRGEVDLTNFFLAYHGLNNRDLHRRIAALYAAACPSLGHVAAHCRGWRRPGKRVKIGFISGHLRQHSIGNTTRGLIARLDRQRFESHALFLGPIVDDKVSRFIREAAEVSVVVATELARAREAVGALELDILFYQDIGMEPFSYFLAFSRLAPVQCVSFGHPDTTGIPAMDYFISNDLFEPPGAEAHYSERLFQLHDLGTLAYYYRPEMPQPKSRAELGLPLEGRLYLCPQTLFKLHPDFDDIAVDILRRDRAGHLVLIRQGVPHWATLTRQRLERLASDVMDRIHFIPPQPGSNFLALLAAADVVLDTVHFNGMNTSLEALSVRTPVVTLPTDQQRGRHTQGMYRKMGLTDCIAADAADYAAIAMCIAGDPGYRQELSRRIGERNGVLFEDPRVVAEFERFFETAVSAASAD